MCVGGYPHQAPAETGLSCVARLHSFVTGDEDGESDGDENDAPHRPRGGPGDGVSTSILKAGLARRYVAISFRS